MLVIVKFKKAVVIDLLGLCIIRNETYVKIFYCHHDILKTFDILTTTHHTISPLSHYQILVEKCHVTKLTYIPSEGLQLRNFHTIIYLDHQSPHRILLTSKAPVLLVDAGRVVVVGRAVGLAVLRHLGVQTFLLDRRLRLRRHGGAGRRTGIGPGTRAQNPFFRRREYAVAVARVDVAVGLDLQTLGRREGGRRREGLQVGQGTEGARAQGEARMEELGLKVVQDVGRDAAVRLHVAEAEAGGRERSVQLLRRLRHGELEHKS